MSFTAKYFDGVRAVSQTATVLFAEQGLVIMPQTSGERLTWLYADLDSPAAIKPGVSVTLSPEPGHDARLVIDDGDFANELLDHAPHLGRSIGRRKLKTSEWVFIGLASVACLLLASIFIPATNKYIAKVLPHTLEKRLAQQTKAFFIRDRHICEDPEAQKIIDDLASRLTQAYPVKHLQVRIVDIPWANAFALAGGEVFFTQGIMKKFSTGEQFAGVLAHEIAHQVESHPGQSVIRILGIEFIIQIFFGDDTVLSSVGGTAVLFAFSREMERDADAIAVKMLQSAGIDPNGLAEFFEIIDQLGKSKKDVKNGKESKDKKSTSIFNYFSTHPLTTARRDFVTKNAGGPGKPAMALGDWEKLKDRCTNEFKLKRSKKSKEK